MITAVFLLLYNNIPGRHLGRCFFPLGMHRGESPVYCCGLPTPCHNRLATRCSWRLARDPFRYGVFGFFPALFVRKNDSGGIFSEFCPGIN